jgi:outer membrane protein assembly factor BamB
LAYVEGSKHYCIDLNTGTTFWKNRQTNSFHNRISGIGDTYFIKGPPTDTLAGYDVQVGYKGNLSNGVIEQFLIPSINLNTGGEGNKITAFDWIQPYKSGNRNYLVAVSSNPYPNWNYDVRVGLYDYDNSSWVYDTIQVALPKQNNVVSNVYVYEEKIYLTAGNEIACHNLWTGERIWKSYFPLDFLFSGFIVADGRVVANCENNVLYGLNANTGAPLWTGEGSGTSSFLEGRYLNEVVYFSGGSSGKIHAVDTKTGKTVWKLDPALADDGADWKSAIYVVPGQNGDKGRVIVCTHNNAYCLEAYR